MDERIWMSPEQVRAYLGGIGERTLARYRKLGLYPNYVTPNTPRYHKDDVDAWVKSRAEQNSKEAGQ